MLADRLITIDETKIIDEMIGECHADHLKKQGVSADVLLNDAENANIYTTFTAAEPDGAYRPIDDLAQLSKVLEAKLVEYNESNAMMDLVLFDDAMSHISRIARIISNPAGNAMLIGVGGSGKQSLTKLAAFICGYETKQLEVTSAYSENDFKEDIKLFYTLCCSKDTPMVLLMTDSQIVNLSLIHI